MQRVMTTPLSITSYQDDASPEALAELERIAESLRGLRVLHVNATPVGGGVAEILQSEIPLLQSLGIAADWWTIDGAPEFFEVTKSIHNALQGNPRSLTKEQKAIYIEWQQRNAEHFPHDYDLVMIHDPQPLGLLQFAGKGDAEWIWRLHIDSSHPNTEVFEFVSKYLLGYDAAIFTLPEFAPPDIVTKRIQIIAPAIDPLTIKNRSLAYGTALKTLRSIGLDPRQPMIAQISRLDPWKDPCGVIDAFRIIRQRQTDLQLVLLGVIAAKDDPEAYSVYDQVVEYAEDDPSIHIYIDPEIIGPEEVAAVQMASQVVFQKSLREGFGLTVSEALWKSTPVVGGRVGGIPLQLQNGIGGFLVDSIEEAADRAGWLLNHTAEARVYAARGRERVRERFLITRLLRDELSLYSEALGLSTPLQFMVDNYVAAG